MNHCVLVGLSSIIECKRRNELRDYERVFFVRDYQLEWYYIRFH